MTGAGEAVVRTVLDTSGGAGGGEGRGAGGGEGRGAGPGGLVRRSVELPAGSRFEGMAGPGGELWFMIAGSGRLAFGAGPAARVGPDVRYEPAEQLGPEVQAEPDTGVWLPPGTSYHLRGDGPDVLRLDSVCLPSGAAPGFGAGRARLSRLRDCPAEVAGDRRFRVLFGPGHGCDAATQFVGEIPPGRAPEHSHPYDEVVLILAGEGVLHAGPASRLLGPDSCAHLPPGRPHCLENTGRATLRVLGVFHPGGSPAAKRTGPS